MEAAKELNRKLPDDVMLYGFLTDANVELGNYKDAEAAAQWMLDLKPGNMPGLTRAAYLRELFGDVDGSMDLMNMAYQSTPPSEVEDAAWIVTQMAHLDLSIGKIDEAEKLSQQALAMFPGYHYALGNLAKVRIQQKRYDDAVELLTQRYQAAPHAENLFDLARALQWAGRKEEAQKAFAEFEQKSLLETNRADNSNHELIFYYADYANQPAKALEVAQREYARRHDVFTTDCYAWALHLNNRNQEALESDHGRSGSWNPRRSVVPSRRRNCAGDWRSCVCRTLPATVCRIERIGIGRSAHRVSQTFEGHYGRGAALTCWKGQNRLCPGITA